MKLSALGSSLFYRSYILNAYVVLLPIISFAAEHTQRAQRALPLVGLNRYANSSILSCLSVDQKLTIGDLTGKDTPTFSVERTEEGPYKKELREAESNSCNTFAYKNLMHDFVKFGTAEVSLNSKNIADATARSKLVFTGTIDINEFIEDCIRYVGDRLKTGRTRIPGELEERRVFLYRLQETIRTTGDSPLIYGINLTTPRKKIARNLKRSRERYLKIHAKLRLNALKAASFIACLEGAS